MIDNNGLQWRSRWKYKLLVYDDGNQDRGGRGLELGLWLHYRSGVRNLLFLLNWCFFCFTTIDNVAIIVYLLYKEVFVLATLSSVAADADITLSWDIAILESAGAVKFAIYLVFSFIRPDAALNFVFLVRYEDDTF